MSIISTQHLSRHYGRRVGIDGVDLAVAEGSIFGFLGPNGAGKTTLIRILLGFLRPGTGSARIFGLDCWRDSSRIKRDVGYVPGDLRLYPWMTCRSALSIVSEVRGADVRDSGAKLSDRFRLEMNVRVRKMSRGMRQKLGLILALAHAPRLLILDEPTSGLDPLMQDELAECLRERAGNGATIFFSSHTLSEVEKQCDRVAIVRRGRLVADEALAALRKRAGRQVAIEFDRPETAASLEAPAFLSLDRRDGARWTCLLSGPTPPLLHWLRDIPVRDLAIGPPDLEHVFRRHYGEDDA